MKKLFLSLLLLLGVFTIKADEETLVDSIKGYTIGIPRNFEASESRAKFPSDWNNVRVCRGQTLSCYKYHVVWTAPNRVKWEYDYWKMYVDYYDWAGKQRGWLYFTANEFEKFREPQSMVSENCYRDEYRKMNTSKYIWLYNPETNGWNEHLYDEGVTYRFRWLTDEIHGSAAYYSVGDDNYNGNAGFRAFTSSGSDYSGSFEKFQKLLDNSTKVE